MSINVELTDTEALHRALSSVLLDMHRLGMLLVRRGEHPVRDPAIDGPDPTLDELSEIAAIANGRHVKDIVLWLKERPRSGEDIIAFRKLVDRANAVERAINQARTGDSQGAVAALNSTRPVLH